MAEKLSLKKLTEEFSRFQDQKYSDRGNVEARVLKAICAAHGEHWTGVWGGTLQFTHEDSGIHVPFNFIRNRKRKLKGRLSAVSPVFKAQPNTDDPADADRAKVVDKLTAAIDLRVDQSAVTDEITEWLLVAGLAVEHVPWIPNKTREPMPVRLEDMPELAEAFPEADPQEILWRDLKSPEELIIPESLRELLIQNGHMPESFEIVEEVREEGDVGSEIHGPLTFFTDISIKDIEKLSPDQSIIFASVKDRSWIEENFEDDDVKELNGGNGFDALRPDENIRIVKTNLSRVGIPVNDTTLDTLLPAIQGSKGENDPDMFVCLYRYQPRSKKNPEGRYTIFIPGQLILRDGGNPYEDGIPAVSYHYEPVTTTFFTSGWVTDLIPVNKTFDRVLSDIIDYMKKFAKSPWLGGPGMSEQDFGKGDVSRFVQNGINADGKKLFAQADVAQMPVMMSQLIDVLKASLDDLAGGSDLFQERKFPGQLRGSEAVAWLQEIVDTQYGPLFTHIAERMARVKQMRINRWKQFAAPIRTLHYMTRDDRTEVFQFHKDKILRPGVEYNITIERGSLVPELRAMREARIRERLQGPLSVLYMDERTGMLDKGKIAADLQMGDASREARESKARKLARDFIERLRSGQQVIPPQPWMDPLPMLDEFEDVMNDMDFIEGSGPMQEAITGYWNALSQMAQQRAQSMQQAMQSQQNEAMQAQALQQTLARASAETVDAAKDELRTTIQAFVQQLTTNPEFVNQLMFAAGQDQVRQ